ncbi:unnamed protein product [Ilex paraguariensis]|uniref:Uncharacterized protein n=1 Tax=Ilex paraguariensis TaxID=185542 RepID=A0ABC8QT34_9AQUA
MINAFTVRALRDTFSPARGAGRTRDSVFLIPSSFSLSLRSIHKVYLMTGIMALCATSSYYDITEIATRILPNVVVLTIDPDSDVRSKAFQAVDQFLQILKQYNEKTNAGESTAATSIGISSIPGNASLLGWAMSSLTLKGKPSEQTAPATSNSSAPLTSVISNASSSKNEVYPFFLVFEF